MKWFYLVMLLASSASSSASAEDIDFDALVHSAFTAAEDDAARAKQKTAFDTFKKHKVDSVKALMNYAHLRHTQIGYWAGWLSRHSASNETARLNRTLAPFLDSKYPRTRSRAAFCLGLHPDPAYAARVRKLLDHGETAGNALLFLGRTKDRGSLNEISAFTRHEKERLRIYTVNALREIADPSSVPELLRAADDPVFTVRRAAIDAIAAIGPKALPAIRTHLEGEVPVRVKRGLVEMLAGMGGRDLLRSLSRDADPRVRREAVRELGRTTTPAE